MIGISLPFKGVFDKDYLQKYKPVLIKLKESGVQSIELRIVRKDADPTEVLNTADFLWNLGFQITVHGEMNSIETAVSDVFVPVGLLLNNLRQDSLNINVHPLNGDTVKALISLSNHINSSGCPVTISLENNRRLPDKSEGDSTALILDVIKKTCRDNVGICFDLGHYRYYLLKNCPSALNSLPETEFYKYVTHMHIHALDGLLTHFPLGKYDLPLKELISPVVKNYKGIYNIELSLERFEDRISPESALLESVYYLRNCLAESVL